MLILLTNLVVPPNNLSPAENKKTSTKATVAKIKKNLGPYVGRVLIFVLSDKRVAKGILLSFDAQNVFIRNKYGDFPLPLEKIHEILILRESPNLPGMPPGHGRRVEQLTDQTGQSGPGMNSYIEPLLPPPGQKGVPRLPKVTLTLGGVGATFNDTYYRKILTYPWPGSTMKVEDFPFGADGHLSLFFDYTRIMYFEAYFRYVSMKTQTNPNQVGGLFVDKIEGIGHSLYGSFGFFFTSPAHLNEVLSYFSKRIDNNKYTQWLKHVIPYGLIHAVTRAGSLKHSSALAKIQIAQDLWGGEIGFGFNIDFGKRLPGFVWKIGSGIEFLHGYSSVNANATDQTAYVWKLLSSIAWEFRSGVVVQVGYSFENERYFYRKLFLSDPPYEPNPIQSGHFLRMAVGYTLY